MVIVGLPSDGKGHEWTLGWILPEMLQAVTPWTSPPALRAILPEEGSSWRWPQGMGRPWCRRTRGPRSMGVNSLRAPVGGTSCLCGLQTQDGGFHPHALVSMPFSTMSEVPFIRSLSQFLKASLQKKEQAPWRNGRPAGLWWGGNTHGESEAPRNTPKVRRAHVTLVMGSVSTEKVPEG